MMSRATALLFWRTDNIAADKQTRLNDQITAPKVRLIGSDGEQVGIVEIKEALEKAVESGLDLVEIAPTAEPPVCRIMDFGKYRYEASKKRHEAKKKQKLTHIKEI
jgi:translation initiation factor IF-3